MRLPGIQGISDPHSVEFTPIGEGYLKKHGRQKCPCCREAGIERVVEIGPAVNGASRIKAAVCRDHEDQGRKVFVAEWNSFALDASEAALSMRF